MVRMIGEAPPATYFRGGRQILVDSDDQRVTFLRCFRFRGLRRSNPARHSCAFEDVLAVHDFVQWANSEEDGPRASKIVTPEGTAIIDEQFTHYDELREFLKDLCRERTDRGPWHDDPNLTEPFIWGVVLLAAFLCLLLAIATS
jgi:hypothetical protein